MTHIKRQRKGKKPEFWCNWPATEQELQRIANFMPQFKDEIRLGIPQRGPNAIEALLAEGQRLNSRFGSQFWLEVRT